MRALMGMRVVPRAFSSSLADELFIFWGVALKYIAPGVDREG